MYCHFVCLSIKLSTFIWFDKMKYSYYSILFLVTSWDQVSEINAGHLALQNLCQKWPGWYCLSHFLKRRCSSFKEDIVWSRYPAPLYTKLLTWFFGLRKYSDHVSVKSNGNGIKENSKCFLVSLSGLLPLDLM